MDTLSGQVSLSKSFAPQQPLLSSKKGYTRKKEFAPSGVEGGGEGGGAVGQGMQMV